jgi:hypothetical protein
MNIQDCIVRVKNAADLTDQEAQDILDRVKAERDRLGAEGKLDQAETALTDYANGEIEREKLQAALNARQTARQVLGRRKAQERISTLVSEGLGAEEAIFADMVGTEKAVASGRKSTYGVGQAYTATAVGPIAKYLKTNPDVRKLLNPSLINKEQRAASQQFLDNVVVEMTENRPGGKSGRSGDPKAQEFGRLLSAASELRRTQLNKAGADIGKLQHDGWVPHQYHETLVYRAGRDLWVDRMLQELDLEKSFSGIESQDEIREILGQSWHNITLGRQQFQIKPEQKSLIKGMRISKRFEKSRLFHFKDAEAWLRIHREFGRGNVFDAVIGHLRHSSQTLAAMERYGPNPEATLDRIITDTVRTMEKGKPTDEIRKELGRLKSNNLQRRRGRIGHAFSEIMGETFQSQNMTASKWSQGTRNWVSMSKLGGATLSALADTPLVNHVFKQMGLKLTDRWSRTMETLFSRYSTEERKQLSYMIDAFSDGLFGDIHSRIALFEEGPGWTSKVSNFFYKASGLTQWTDNLKAGFNRMAMSEMGLNSTKAWDNLTPEYRDLLERGGFTADKWKAIKHMGETLKADGKKYIFPENSDLIPDSALDRLRTDEIARAKKRYKNKPKLLDAALERIRGEARQELELDVVGFVRDLQTHAVIEPDARTRLFMYRGTQPGTVAGESLRFIGQFKSFPVAFVQKVLAPTFYGRKGQGVLSRSMDMAKLMATLTFFGYISMTAKQAARGQKAADPTESWARAFGVIGAAFVQGGGAGIYGDFLLGEYNRFGRSLPETAAGAVISGPVSDVSALWASMIRGEFKAGTALKMATDNTPFINLFYTRTALDYLLLYHLQEMASPGVLKKREQRMKQATGRDYLVPPSTVIKRGGGFR